MQGHNKPTWYIHYVLFSIMSSTAKRTFPTVNSSTSTSLIYIYKNELWLWIKTLSLIQLQKTKNARKKYSLINKHKTSKIFWYKKKRKQIIQKTMKQALNTIIFDHSCSQNWPLENKKSLALPRLKSPNLEITEKQYFHRLFPFLKCIL